MASSPESALRSALSGGGKHTKGPRASPLRNGTDCVVIHGPMGCGKTRNAAMLADRFGCRIVFDGWEGGKLKPPSRSLILTNLPASEARGNSRARSSCRSRKRWRSAMDSLPLGAVADASPTSIGSGPPPTLQEIAALPFPASRTALSRFYDPHWGKFQTEGELRTWKVEVEWETVSTDSETYSIEAASEEEAIEMAREKWADEGDGGWGSEITSVTARWTEQ